MPFKGNKYGRKSLEHAGYTFASKLEAAVFDILKLRERAGEISDIKTQEAVYLTLARIMFKPDFSYLENSIRTYAEAKGMETPVYAIKRRLWAKYGPSPLHVYKGTYKNPQLFESIFPEVHQSDMTL